MRNENCTVGELVDLLSEVDRRLEIEYWSVSVYGEVGSTEKVHWEARHYLTPGIHELATSSMHFRNGRQKAADKCVRLFCPNGFVYHRTVYETAMAAINDKSKRKELKMLARKPLKEWSITELMLLTGIGIKTAGKMLVKIHTRE